MANQLHRSLLCTDISHLGCTDDLRPPALGATLDLLNAMEDCKNCRKHDPTIYVKTQRFSGVPVTPPVYHSYKRCAAHIKLKQSDQIETMRNKSRQLEAIRFSGVPLV